MYTADKNRLVILFFLQFPALLWVYWSFKMDISTFDPCVKDSNKKLFRINEERTPKKEYCEIPAERFFWDHLTKGILDAGVCPMGKGGAWTILIWTIIMLTTLTSVYYTENKDEIKECHKALAYINMTFMAILFGLTLKFNAPLLIRSLPYFFLNVAITLILFNADVEC